MILPGFKVIFNLFNMKCRKEHFNALFHFHCCPKEMSLFIVFLFSTIFDPSFGFGVAVEIEPDFHPMPCMDDKKFYYLDWSQLTVISDHKASKIYFNGTITYVKDVGDGIRLNFTSERFHDGQWIPGELKFEWNDFCAMMGDPLKQPVVYRVMQRGFKQKKCTFKAGVRSIREI